ncbi:hypothetical protein [Sinomonas sp. ASV322]|uniref:hypothetical protein n=1 Tax=Sinomonas sp. ASV322 TaxID=3041920 RepID=UPI0027DB47E1|nr:hypothetical protein [Sinomonas sp. ASV322]MDQ4502543.1 hypothetical protein [Sinomonas sp. ASV322]
MIGEWEFESDYRPIPTAEGDLVRHIDQTRGYPMNRVWSIVEPGDNNLYAIPGYHLVNLVGYVVTETPWHDEELEAEWFISQTEEE